MIDTLDIGDHVFVNKVIYGPELLPGLSKLPSPVKPKRNDIIIFENPSYISRGPVFDIAQRVIYMLTLSLVDIDKDKFGNPRVHFLIKRAVGQAGDRFMLENGEIKICFAGEDRWVDEREYNAKRGWNHKISRLIKEDHYPVIEAAGRAAGWSDRGINISENLMQRVSSSGDLHFLDIYAHERAWLETLRKASPHDERYKMRHAKNTLGWYVPDGRIFPMGDNRDNSNDGRAFGSVKISRVLGKGMVIYWPYWRIRGIR